MDHVYTAKVGNKIKSPKIQEGPRNWFPFVEPLLTLKQSNPAR